MKTIDFDKFKTIRDAQDENDVLIINTLSAEDFQEKHIPGSVNVPFKDNARFTDEVEKLAGSKNRKIMVYCAKTDCPVSAEAAEALDEAGFTKVYDFEAGMAGWEEMQGNVARAA